MYHNFVTADSRTRGKRSPLLFRPDSAFPRGPRIDGNESRDGRRLILRPDSLDASIPLPSLISGFHLERPRSGISIEHTSTICQKKRDSYIKKVAFSSLIHIKNMINPIDTVFNSCYHILTFIDMKERIP